jgi:hypothetical protein
MLVILPWIISHDNRFKAACAQRGVYDLNFWNAWRLVPNYFEATHGTKN